MDAEQERVERVLEAGLERVQTPEAAKAVIARVELLSRGKTEAQTGEAAAHPSAASETDKERAAAVTIEVVERRRFVKWEGGEDLYHAPHWVWSLVAQAEERGRREGAAPSSSRSSGASPRRLRRDRWS